MNRAPYEQYLMHRFTHVLADRHLDCPWCNPPGERHEESPWFTLGNIKIYGPR